MTKRMSWLSLIMPISSFFQTLRVAFSNANLLHMHTVSLSMPVETHAI